MAPSSLPNARLLPDRPRGGIGTTPKAKRRTSRLEKLAVLTPGLLPDQAEEWLNYFCSIFCFRLRDAVVTRVGQGPRAWTAKRGILSLQDVARHLLGDAIPHLLPQWVGARSFATSYFFCLDVDCDRHAPAVNAASNQQRSSPPSFTERIDIVFQALRRVCIDPNDRRQVLILPTPSGGRHIYVFFDKPYFVDQYHDLLRRAGLRFAKGQIEFFPSQNQALRLPFGHIPGATHDPTAWLRFIRDYRVGRIKRFHLDDLWQALLNGGIKAPQHLPAGKINLSISRSAVPSRKRTSVTMRTAAASPGPITRSAAGQFVPPKCIQDVERLLANGITIPGTRNAALLALAQHFIFIRGMTAAVAAKLITEWALNPRHASKDIHHDLRHGTDVVAREIQRMCRWCEAKRDPNRRTIGTKVQSTAAFTREEIEELYEKISAAPEPKRAALVDFVLSFLAFAKQHGKARSDGTAWHAAPAVNAVIRKWPGCHHMHYKAHIELAIELGLFQMVRDKWQNPNGNGRARTYELTVKVSYDSTSLDFDSARRQLIAPSIDAGRERAIETANIPAGSNTDQEPNHEHLQNDANQRINPSGEMLAPPVHQSRPRGDLASCPRQRPPQPYAAQRLRRRRAAVLRANLVCQRRCQSCSLIVGVHRSHYCTGITRTRGPPTKPLVTPRQAHHRE